MKYHVLRIRVCVCVCVIKKEEKGSGRKKRSRKLSQEAPRIFIRTRARPHHTLDFVPDYKYPSTESEYRHVFFCVFHESPRFHLGHVSAVDSVLTGQYIRIDNGAIQRALYVSFSLSLFPAPSLLPTVVPFVHPISLFSSARSCCPPNR